MTNKWILCSEKAPPKGLFWGFVEGRMEMDHHMDSLIQLFVNEGNLRDIRTLDYASRYSAEDYNGIHCCEKIIAWMPVEDMVLPEGFSLT